MYTKRECEYGPGEWPRECGTCAHVRQSPNYPQVMICKILVEEDDMVEEEMVCKFHVMKKN